MKARIGIIQPLNFVDELVDFESAVEKYAAVTRVAKEAERLGFTSIMLYDHFYSGPPRLEDTFECWTTTAALARDTSTIRIGQLVTCNGYRPPSLLAKMASTVDVLSGGRLDFGIGAGWYEAEFTTFGYPFPGAPERLQMLEEALQVIRAMFTEPYATFEGKYYRVEGAINQPKGVQQPHIPIWIGGDGEKVTLRLVAKYADACNIGGIDPERYRHKLSVLREHCEREGRDYSTILKSAVVDVNIVLPGQTPQQATERKRKGRSLEDHKGDVIVGSPQEIIEGFTRILETGIEYIVIAGLNDIAHLDTLRYLGEEVLPAFA